MSLLAQIKKDQLTARKSKDLIAASLLTTLIGEAEMVGKNDGNRDSTDAEVVAVIKKFVKNANDTLKVLSATDSRGPNLLAELEILEGYLPAQFTEDDLTRILSNIQAEIFAGPKDMGKMLGLLKARHAGEYDGALASKVAKAVLAQ